MMNEMKRTQQIPEILKYCNITSLFKNKGSRKDFANYSNVGARKKRNIRNNIFVTNSILNSIARRKLKDIDIGVYDREKCFDKLWAQECINDMVASGFKNDKLTLLYEENVNAKVAVKTKSGTTRRITMSEIIIQGTVWGSLFC